MSGVAVKLKTDEFNGDKSGRLTVRRGQSFEMAASRLYLPSALLTQQESEITLPTKIDCMAVDIVYKG